MAGSLALAGLGLVALAPAAQAGTVTATVHCTLPAGQGESEGPQDITVELTPATAAPGDQVTAKVTLGPGPAKSTVTLDDVLTTPTIDLAMRGGASGTVTVTGAEVPLDVVTGESPPIPPYEGKFTVPASADGKVEFTVSKMISYTKLFGSTFQTVCNVVAGGDQTVAELTVGGGTGDQPTLNVGSPSAYTGTEITLTGTKYAPNATPSAQLCQADGTGCNALFFSSTNLAIDGSGNLSGKAKLATNVPDGDYLVQVADGAKSATAPLHVSKFVPSGDPVWDALSPASGPVGTVVQVSGSNLPPNTAVRLNGVNASDGLESGSKNYTTTGDGKLLPSPYTISTANTTNIRATLIATPGSPRYLLPFSVAAGQDSQGVNVTFAPGPLSMSQAGNAIDFGSATLNGQAQTLNGSLNQVTVVDARGGNLGWSLTGTMTDLVAGNGTDKIPAGNISWTPSCAASPGSISTVTSGTPGALGSAPSTLCTQAADSKTTGGSFTADAAMKLTTPEFAAAGTYTGTLTLTLV
ncbi:WxL domain-containing protein [Yinghuangia sp. YIM S09857]|uniref:WxL domain-containing protein n=1 Tax=Yinghuangia sp. YIM S09857 TaxID=3436929 RepID=UPI003F530358